MRGFFLALFLSGSFGAAFASGARAGDVTLQNVVLRNGQTTLNLPQVVFFDTNVTPDQARVLFSDSASAQDKQSVVGILKASKIVIPTVTATTAQGAFDVAGLEADGVAAGKASRVSFVSAKGSVEGKDKAEIDFQSRPLTLGGVDFAALLKTRGLSLRASGLRAEQISWAGFDASVLPPRKAADASASGPWTFSLASLQGTASYQGSVPVRASSSLQHLVVRPPAGSSAAQLLQGFGYDALDFGLSGSSDYDPTSQVYDATHVLLTANQMGAMTLDVRLGSVTTAAFDGPPADRRAAIARSDLLTLDASFLNNGLFDKVLSWYADQTGLPRAAVRSRWAATATLLIPVMMQGAPASLPIAQAVSAFIQSPKTLTLNIKAKDGGVPLSEFGRLDRKDLLSQLDLDAKAGD